MAREAKHRSRGSGKSVSPAFEAARIILAAAAGIFALRPFLHNGIVGGDDAKWYAAVVADHLEQWRMGFWPVFVGQSRFSAIGTVLPLRVAPYLQHLTVFLDLATFRMLSPYVLLNLAIVASGAGGGLSAYLCLRSIIPKQRAAALLLAILYVWSPGVIGLPYTGQLFMSEMTLPFLPMVFTGVYRIFGVDDTSGWVLAATGCAGCWLAHSPIGLWASVATALALVVRWLSGIGWNRREARHLAIAGLLFVGLCGYVFVSLHVLAAPDIGHIPRSLAVQNIRNTFPAVLLPVTRYASEVTDLQLGWSLSAVLIAGISVALFSKRPALRALAITGLFLACLALPVPGINRGLWAAVPQAFIDVTNAAPTQRLYAILASCTATLAAGCLAAYPRYHVRFAILLGLAVGWSGLEIRPFLLRGALISNSKARTEEALRPENLLMTRFSLGMLTYDNRFFSNGVMDYALEQRVLAPNLRTYIVSDVAAIAPGHDFGRRSTFPELPHAFVGTSPKDERVWVNLDKTLTLQPGGHYLLALDFPSPDWPGILQLKGDGFLREYALPSSGMPFAFGSGKLSSRVIPLSSSATKPMELTVTFINQDPDADMHRFHDFARYELIPYDPDRLPIRLKSLVPYVAEVHSPSPGWLETFRCFTPGWTATVNGRPAPVRRSWNGLVAVPIGQGNSVVGLFYRPPGILVTSYWLTWVAWGAVGFFGVRRICFKASDSRYR